MSKPGKKQYDEYMASDRWQVKRQDALELAGWKCEKCGHKERLHVHHLTYDRFGHERLSDLRVLCESCHDRDHANLARLRPAVEMWITIGDVYETANRIERLWDRRDRESLVIEMLNRILPTPDP